MKNPADISKNRILPSDVFACFCWNQSMQKHPIYTVLRNTSLPLFKYFKIIIIVSEFQESHLERCGFKSWNVPAQVWSPGGKSWRLCIHIYIYSTLRLLGRFTTCLAQTTTASRLLFALNGTSCLKNEKKFGNFRF